MSDVMDKDEVIEFLKENLTISVEQVTEFGPYETISVTLKLGDLIISEASCSLPD